MQDDVDRDVSEGFVESTSGVQGMNATRRHEHDEAAESGDDAHQESRFHSTMDQSRDFPQTISQEADLQLSDRGHVDDDQASQHTTPRQRSKSSDMERSTENAIEGTGTADAKSVGSTGLGQSKNKVLANDLDKAFGEKRGGGFQEQQRRATGRREREGGGGGKGKEGEDRERLRDVASWGRDYSSFTHMKVVTGIRAMSDADVSRSMASPFAHASTQSADMRHCVHAHTCVYVCVYMRACVQI